MKLKSTAQGGTLILAMLVVVVFTGLVAVGQMLSSSQILLTSRSADIDAMQSTAEGLTQYAYGVWRDAMQASALPLTSKQATDLVSGSNRPPLPAGFQYSSFTITALDKSGNDMGLGTDKNGTDTTVPDTIPSLSQDPKGWQANVYEYAARVTLISTRTRKPETVSVEAILRHDLVPPVGGLFFCEGDFELYKPAPMLINGPVHTNGNGFVSTSGTTASTKLEFSADSNVSFVGAYAQTAPPGATAWSPITSASDTGTPIFDRSFDSQVSHVNAVEGIGMGTATQYNTTDTNPNNDSNRELIERPVAGYTDPAGIANSRLYNNAGLVVDISGPVTGTVAVTASGTNTYTGNNVTITGKNGTVLTSTAAKAIINAISNATTTTTPVTTTTYDPVKKKNVTTTTNVTTTSQTTVYDKRESANVLVSDVDLGAVNSTLNSLSNFNDIIYINNTGQASGDPAAIRLTDAGVLPSDGLTVATEGGLYVIGDYNTGTTTNPSSVPANSTGNPAGTSQPYVNGYSTKPAALVADAVMFLSNNWDDSNAAKSVSSRAASNTTVNTAIIAGYIPSNWTNPDTNETYWYSGGANNFPRFLENWSNKTMTFTGAMVQLYKSKMFTGEWDTADIYSPPVRRWSFDKLLLSRVIPGIPAASSFSIDKVRTFMKTWLAVACLVLSALPGQSDEVNFRVSNFAPEVPEGPVRLRPYFEVGRRRISFRAPYRGRLSSGPEGLTIFLDENGFSGEIKITNSTFSPSADFAARADDYHDAAEATLPKEAEKPELLGAKNDLYAVNGWKSLGFAWKYTQASRSTHRQVAWMNLDPVHQVCITIVSDEDFWPATEAVAKRFLTSWYWVADDAKLTPTAP